MKTQILITAAVALLLALVSCKGETPQQPAPAEKEKKAVEDKDKKEAPDKKTEELEKKLSELEKKLEQGAEKEAPKEQAQETPPPAEKIEQTEPAADNKIAELEKKIAELEKNKQTEQPLQPEKAVPTAEKGEPETPPVEKTADPPAEEPSALDPNFNIAVACEKYAVHVFEMSTREGQVMEYAQWENAVQPTVMEMCLAFSQEQFLCFMAAQDSKASQECAVKYPLAPPSFCDKIAQKFYNTVTWSQLRYENMPMGDFVKNVKPKLIARCKEATDLTTECWEREKDASSMFECDPEVSEFFGIPIDLCERYAHKVWRFAHGTDSDLGTWESYLKEGFGNVVQYCNSVSEELRNCYFKADSINEVIECEENFPGEDEPEYEEPPFLDDEGEFVEPEPPKVEKKKDGPPTSGPRADPMNCVSIINSKFQKGDSWGFMAYNDCDHAVRCKATLWSYCDDPVGYAYEVELKCKAKAGEDIICVHPEACNDDDSLEVRKFSCRYR